MKIPQTSISAFDFEGLQIADYTAGTETSSSLAEITVPPGAVHPRAYSTRSDKYYYVVSGTLRFDVEAESYDLTTGDVCLILKGQRFSYRNTSQKPAKLVLVHTPAFDPESEVFEETEHR